MNTFLLVGGVLMVSVGLVLAFRQSSGGAMFSYLGMWSLAGSGYALIPQRTLMFWAIATVIVCGIGMARLTASSLSATCRRFIVGGTLTGMIAGLTCGQGVMIILAAAGAVAGGVIFRNTPAGRSVAGSIWPAITEAGLPAIVAMSMAGISLSGLLARHPFLS